MEKVLAYIEIGRKEGAKLLTGGKAYREGDCAKGYFIEPTIFADVEPTMRIAQEEIFGPVVSVLKARDLEDAITYRQRDQVRSGLFDLYTGCEQISSRGKGTRYRHRVYKRLDHRR